MRRDGPHRRRHNQPPDGAGKPQVLIHSSNAQFPFSFTADGKRLVFMELSPESGFDIWTVPLESDDTGLRAGKPQVWAMDGLLPRVSGPAISWLPRGAEATLEAVARQTGVDFTPLPAAISTGVHDTKRLRIAMYQRFGGGNMDEGWVGAVDERTIREYIENQNWDEDEEGFKIAARFPAGGHLGPVGMNFCSA